MLDCWDNKKKIYWIMECDVIAGSASYVVNGHPQGQVTSLRDALRRAADAGFSWREIYDGIYQRWHTRRPHFPHPETMATLIER